MKIQKLNKLLIIALIQSVTIVTAQKSDPNFVNDLGGNIEKMTVTDSGVLLITHGKGLAGIKPGQ
ncbi:MAG: hypothetical protein Q7U59_00345 [Lutibacter sp.]|nr:hypothetical protein [Lutibacter sp.]MDP2067422.1 hypothetical protein [Lutibacter sp.]